MTRKATTIRRLSDLEVFSMANALTEDTGLPMVVYISQKNVPHGPRIKVSKSYEDKVIQGELVYDDDRTESKSHRQSWQDKSPGHQPRD